MRITKLFPLLISSLVLSGIALSIKDNHQEVKEVKASEEISLSSSGDSFTLLDKQYSASESFVYTGDLNFKSGQAGGLAFGSEENDHYFVINMDRVENTTKLLYFTSNGAGGYSAETFRSDYFIGNDKITESELNMVKPMVRDIETVNLKVIVTIEEEHAYAEFFIEGIKRFGVDSKIDLNNLRSGLTYQGGYLGLNCFNADVLLNNIEIGKSDYSYFSELYRNQYHLQPFAKWTNDPNALCYHNGYYHVYYQTNPFGKLWGPMFWGHARSKDLIHFEFLPICLFPDITYDTLGPGEEVENKGYMWSGCAISYKKGMSDDIDSKNWFPNGSGNGMLAIYTREGRYQDQQIITSDDDGLTWTKRDMITHHIYYAVSEFENQRIDWRDPKIVPLTKDSGGKVTTWVMTLSSMDKSLGWFLTSSNLINWTYSGHFSFPRPECIGIGYLKDNNDVEHAYLTNKSRTYILGELSYDSVHNRVNFVDEDGVNLYDYNADNVPLKPLDFGPDTYASQSFYINDEASEFNGKDIVLNWFSGDLNASYCTGPGEYASLRSRWNGGFTIPVKYGVLDTGSDLRITQKPITVGNSNLEKTPVININNQNINSESANPLKDVHTHIFEMDASITVNDNSPIIFKVDLSNEEYMEFGWNKEDGYYVDRTNLDDKGINTNIDWHTKYASHILGDSNTKTFYVLSDNGGLEVFCEDYSISFYFVTTASPGSTGASLFANDALINQLKINEVKSIYRKNIAEGEGVLYISSNEVELDTKLNTAKFVSCWYSGVSDLSWEEIENEDVVSYEASNQGINFVALKPGTASFKLTVSDEEEIINVNVYDGYFESDFHFEQDNIVSGEWIMSDKGIVGERSSGNGFILTNEVGADFTFTGQFSIDSGVAASLVFRASADMSSYLVANYDSGERIVKLWSTHGELARSGVIDADLSNIVLSVKASGKQIEITVNGNLALSYTLLDNEPLSGHFGLNVFSAKATFKSLSLVKENFEYAGGDLSISLDIDQYITGVYNMTLGNRKLEPGYYSQGYKTLVIKQIYFDTIENGTYSFKIVGSSYTMYIKVEVNFTHSFVINDVEVESGVNVNVYVGNHEINSLKVNDNVINEDKYFVHDYVLTIDASCFNVGDNEVTVNDNVTFNVLVNNKQEVIDIKKKNNNTPLIIGLSVGGGVLVGGIIATIIIVVLVKKKGKKA